VEAQSKAGDEDTKTTAITVALRGQLVVAEGPLAGLRFPLVAGSRAVLGRSSKADFTLRDDSVSRRHVEVKVEETEISIRDLESTNGTQVNGKRISDWQPLADGDQILLGDLPLTVRLSS
jgi:pSer/pThr/pTyr-binding forkhead associated (FHA) protein